MKKWLGRFTESARGILDDLLDQDPAHLVLRLTALLLLFHGSSDIFLDVPLRVLCGLALLSPRALTSRTVWLLMVAFVWLINAVEWTWIDNHKYLISYWVLACALAARHTQSAGILSFNARLLVGFVFLFAAGWKIFGGEYLNGEFLTYTLLTDGRMAFLAETIGGMSEVDLAQNRLLESSLKLAPSAGLTVTLTSSPRLEIFAVLLSYWTIALEGVVALLFLLPNRFSPTWLRLPVLMVFIAGTYFFLPVLGFGYVLAIMGLAATPVENRTTRLAWLLLFAVLQLARLPWETWFW